MSDFIARIRAEVDDSQLKKLENIKDKTVNVKVNIQGDLEKFDSLLKSINSQKVSIKVGTDTSGVSKVQSDFQMIKNLANEISQKKIKLAGLDTTKNANQIKELNSQIKKLESDYSALISMFGNSLNVSQLGQLENIFGKTNDKVAELVAKAKDLRTVSDATERIAQAQAKLNDLKNIDGSKYDGSTTYQKMVNNVAQAESAIERLNAELAKGNNANFSIVNESLKQMESYASKADAQGRNLTSTISRLDAMKASNKGLSWLQNNTKVRRDSSLAASIENVSRSLANVTEKGQFEALNKELETYISLANRKGLTGRSWFTDFKRSFGKIAQFAGIYGMIQRVIMQSSRQIVQAVKDTNAATIELMKVSDASDNQIKNYFDEATESAKKYGATISDVISSTADWSRLGYNLEDASTLANATTLLQRVGDNMTQESSSQGLISILKGFNYQADQVNEIIDVINQVANTEPIDTAGIVSALQRSASSLSAAGNDLNQSVSMITAANSVVQDPDTVGTAFRTLSMRIRGAKTELEDANLDTEGMAESTAKLREEILALSGVDIMLNEDTFKSTYDILDELSNKWSELTDIQQANNTCLYVQKCA